MSMQAKIYTRTNDTGIHYARLVVPKVLRQFVNKPAIWRSLSTKDDKEAFQTGAVVAASTQLVLQEVADEYADAAVVMVDVELLGAKFDLEEALESISHDDIALVAQSLRDKLGIKTGGTDDSDSGSNSPNKKSASKATAEKKAANSKVEGHEPKKLEQDVISLQDSDVERYIEKRPHGVYRLRVWIPRKLQRIFGQREVRQTLKTERKTEAIVRARPLLEQVLHQLQELPNPA